MVGSPYIGVGWYNSFAELTSKPGAWGRGSLAWNRNPQVLGPVGSRYVVIGWTRLTDANEAGTNHQLGVDWAEMRTLTGT